MADERKKRMSLLDNLTAAASPAPPPAMQANRPLRAARDAVDAHKIWDLNPNLIDDLRTADRLDQHDIRDLRDSIETSGQIVPILVRRKPGDDGRYLLVYGRRRLEAIRDSDKVETVKALIANLDDDSAVTAQIAENMARRDLSYIEKALFAHELIENGFGNQTRVAEVLTVTKSAVSMALTIVDRVGVELIRTIGPAHGIGRPRWDALAQRLERIEDKTPLCEMAYRARDKIRLDILSDANGKDHPDDSVFAFETVEAELSKAQAAEKTKPKKQPAASGTRLSASGVDVGRLHQTSKGVRLELGSGEFADWFAQEAEQLITELHARWKNRRED